MRRIIGVRGIAALCVAALGLCVSGCAGTSILPGFGQTRSCAGHSDQDGPAAPAREVAVVCRWSAALQAGHLSAAAGYFQLPSVFSNGTGPIAIHTRRQAEILNAGLSCGAQVISAFHHGRYIDVLFRLTRRQGLGSGCGSGVGQSARTVFLIRNGRIVQWLRAPSRPGDPGVPDSGSGGGSQGGGSQGGGSAV